MGLEYGGQDVAVKCGSPLVLMKKMKFTKVWNRVALSLSSLAFTATGTTIFVIQQPMNSAL